MNVLLVSQCDKNALKETRRILDQFAERKGERTWQTPITQQGLDTLRRLLRKTARKNTAVACHWIRGRDHSELLWVVGDTSRFGPHGTVPTNTTTRNILRREDENDWHTAEDIRLLAQLAALLHDLGKASRAFQQRLRTASRQRNLYRHEWISLRLFQAFVGEDDDEAWLSRLADAEEADEQAWVTQSHFLRDGLDDIDPYPFRRLPPLAAAVGWLIVTHHRLPVVPCYEDDGHQAWLGKRVKHFSSAFLEKPLDRVAHDWNEIVTKDEREQVEPFWELAGPLPVIGPKWRAQAARLARRLLELKRLRGDKWLDNLYVMHLARLSLMLADHHYSSLENSPERVEGDGNRILYANTHRAGGLKQPLDEHLLGVARNAGLVAHALPGFERHLPRLANHRGLRKRSADPRFAWQDKAADAAASLREAAREHGAFIVNMASTGCGKTLANARILYALADPQLGMRASYALGLRTLTLQTGRSYRHDLHLGEDDLAIRVGGSASRALFEYYEQQAEARGSASTQDLLEEDGHVLYEGRIADHPLLSRALSDPDVRNLIAAPVLVCTVDHLVPATESLRAGRQIAPMLRLMSADLVLDELDDYGLDDLPALTRLIHWAGMLGARVVLSSATLAPALVEGMFLAYQAGRGHYRRNRGAHGGRMDGPVEIPCLWTDEFGVQTATSFDANGFRSEHMRFVERRAARLAKAEPLRRGELLRLEIASNVVTEQIRAQFATQVRDACVRLHADHAETDPLSGKHISFGLVRMANIDPLFDVARALYALGAPEGKRIHLCVYHARFPLVQRSAIEHLLDTALNRQGDGTGVYHLPAVRTAIDAHPETEQLFVVLASPVCEVGRDWDADWAIAEPSSMRSLIQLAGRVKRHRRRGGQKPNVLIFDTNLRWFEKAARKRDDPPAIFARPGFEHESQVIRNGIFRVTANRLDKLIEPEHYRRITAIPRVLPRAEHDWLPRRSLVDLEQARMTASMLPRSRWPALLQEELRDVLERDQAPVAWEYPQTSLIGLLPQQQPFRDDPQPTETLVFLPDEDEERLILHRIEETAARQGEKLYVPDEARRHEVALAMGAGIGPWGKFDLMALLAEQAEHLELPLRKAAEKVGLVTVPENPQGWRYHPVLGFAVLQ